MNNKKIYLILFLSIAIFLGLIALLVILSIAKPKSPGVGPKIENKTTASSSVKSVVTSGQTKGEAILNEAETNKDPAACLKITDERYADICLELLAQTLQDGSVCSKIKNQAEVLKCADGANFTKAVQSGNIALCQKIQDASADQSCIISIVQKNGLAEKDCQSLPANEKTYCLNYLGSIANNVIYNNAKTVDDCQKISSPKIKLFCLSKVGGK
jgi:hypothetical protein